MLPRLGLGYLGPKLQQQFRNVDFDWAHFGARSAEARCEREPGVLHDAVKLRRDDLSDWTGINPGIVVTADLAVNRAMVQARAATDAEQRTALVGLGEQV